LRDQVPANGGATLDWHLDAKLIAKISRRGLLALQDIIASAKGRSRSELAVCA
jgi:hypothetical protein